MNKGEQMARVRTFGTDIELHIRRELSSRGVKYRLNVKRLPGAPDIYIGRIKLAIFAHGCFWHGHGCSRARLPKSNTLVWRSKISANQHRDQVAIDALHMRDISALIVWGCQIRHFVASADIIADNYSDSIAWRSKPIE